MTIDKLELDHARDLFRKTYTGNTRATNMPTIPDLPQMIELPKQEYMPWVPVLRHAMGLSKTTDLFVQFVQDVSENYVRVIPNNINFITNLLYANKLMDVSDDLDYDKIDIMGAFNDVGWIIEININNVAPCGLSADQVFDLIVYQMYLRLYTNAYQTLYNYGMRTNINEMSPTVRSTMYRFKNDLNRVLDYTTYTLYSAEFYYTPTVMAKCNMDEVYSIVPNFNDTVDYILTHDGNSLIDNTPEYLIETMRNSTRWIFIALADLSTSKAALRNYMTTILNSRDSIKLVSLTKNLFRFLFGYDVDMFYQLQNNTAFSESYRLHQTTKCELMTTEQLKIYDTAYKESANRIYKSINKFDFNDIDRIPVEIDRISDHDDKIYVINLINEHLDDLIPVSNLTDEEFIQYDIKIPRDKITNAIKELHELMIHAKKKKIIPKQYGFFIVYPEGYEG